MRSELNLIRAKMQLLEQFAGVAMAEDRVGGEVIGGVHEVSIVKGSDPFIVKRVFDHEAAGTRIVGQHHDPLFPIMTAVMP